MRETWLRTFTVNFGDDEGNEVTYNGTIIQALMLMNGRELNDAIKARPGKYRPACLDAAAFATRALLVPGCSIPAARSRGISCSQQNREQIAA